MHDVINVPIIFLLFVLSLFLQKMYRHLRFGEHVNWLPREYIRMFKRSTDKPFAEENKFPTECAVLLIIARFRSGFELIKLIDYIADLITLGWVRFHEIIAVDKPCKLKLFYKNISVEKDISEGYLNFLIRYPTDPPKHQYVYASRNWHLPIPELKPGETKTITVDKFFAPELPGDHELIILKKDGVSYASIYGLCGRAYKEFKENDSWSQLFHVSSTYEYKVFIIVFVSLLVALCSLLISLLN